MATSESMRSVSAWIDREDHLLLQSVLNIYSTTRQNALAIGEILMVGVKTFLEEREGDGELDGEARLRIMEWVTRRRLGNQATLNAIAAENNSTIIFPLPIELLEGIAGSKSKSSE